MADRNDFIVQDLFPAREIHLIGGPSGSGKTTLILQIIEAWSQGKEVFGFQSYPSPFCYVACDRSRLSTIRTMDRAGIDRTNIPLLSLIDDGIPYNIDAVIESAKQLVPNLSVLFLDAIAALCPGGKTNDYSTVLKFMTRMTKHCQQHSLTIKGLGHATKVKEGERYLNPRQRFLGSVAWGGFSDTMIHIEPDNPDDPDDPSRTILLMPRNLPGQKLAYTFNSHGRLVPANDQLDSFLIEQHLDHAFGGRVCFRTADILEFCSSHQIAKRTIERVIHDMLEKGKLERIRRGMYRIKSNNSALQ